MALFSGEREKKMENIFKSRGKEKKITLFYWKTGRNKKGKNVNFNRGRGRGIFVG